MTNKNLYKWLAFAFPYIAQLIHRIINFVAESIIKIPLLEADSQTIFILLNSLAILFGINVIKNYTHSEDCENFKPANKKEENQNV